MKHNINILIITSTVLILIAGCKDKHAMLYQRIRAEIDSIKIINTHEHQGYPWMKKHNAFDIGMYMEADLISSGMPRLSDSMINTHDVNAYWEHFSPYLRFSRTTSYYAQFIKNLQQQYGLKGDELTKEEFLRISAEVDSNFKNYTPWLEKGLKKYNIDFMLVDRVWNPFNTNMGHEKFGYVFRFDKLVMDATYIAKTKTIKNDSILKLLNRAAFEIKNLDDYLVFIDDVIQATIKNNVVALKMGLAYHRSLQFNEVTYDRAKELFGKQTISKDEKRELQDYLVYYIAKKAGELNLTIQIHTGYLHGNSTTLDDSNPMKLLTLFLHFPKTKFVIFHGSYPWTGEFVAIGKNFPNVYIDFVWLPQISRTKAISVLHEMLDCVPYNKICWGGDVGKIDETAGSLELGKEVVATVLTERIEKNWITEETAKDICRRIFRENAIEIYNLKKRL